MFLSFNVSYHEVEIILQVTELYSLVTIFVYKFIIMINHAFITLPFLYRIPLKHLVQFYQENDFLFITMFTLHYLKLCK
jgi:hypothetical protein